jgi:ABC-type phosphate transport system substrate-binding protein
MVSKTPRPDVTGFALLTVLACLALLPLLPIQARADTVVVVNAANTTAVDEAAISKIFLKQVKSFPDGSPAAPVNQKKGPSTEDFRAKLLKKNAAQFKAFWAQQIFTGGAKPPPELDGDEAVLKYVAETPGGIGYVEAGKAHAGVRVLKK